MPLRFAILAVLASMVVGCGSGNATKIDEAAKKQEAVKKLEAQKKVDEAIKAHPNLIKAGKLETKALPRGETEVVATVAPDDLDKAMACLSALKINAKSQKEGDFVDVVVAQADTEKAGKALTADADEKGYSIHAKSSSAIKPNT